MITLFITWVYFVTLVRTVKYWPRYTCTKKLTRSKTRDFPYWPGVILSEEIFFSFHIIEEPRSIEDEQQVPLEFLVDNVTWCSLNVVRFWPVAMSQHMTELSSDPDMAYKLSNKNLVTWTELWITKENNYTVSNWQCSFHQLYPLMYHYCYSRFFRL